MSLLIDLSHEINVNLPIYPGDPASRLFQVKTIENDGYCNYKFVTGMHSGTHLDGPLHLNSQGQYLSELSLELFFGEGYLLDVRNQAVIGMRSEYQTNIKEQDIILLYTGHDRNYGTDEYFLKHPVIDPELAEFLVQKKIKIIGMDLPSPDQPPFDVHKLFLNNNILILENLTNLENLLNIERFEIMAFPLKIKADSSILRVVAKIEI